MKVFRDASAEYSDCALKYLEFEDFDTSGVDNKLWVWGYGSTKYAHNREYINSFKYKIYWQHEQPCGFFEGEEDFHRSVGRDFDRVYSTCPFTGQWLNRTVYHEDKYRPTIFPYNAKYAVQGTPDKQYDVIYWGQNVPYSDNVAEILNVITTGQFKHRLYTLGGGMEPWMDHVTGKSVPRQEMWNNLRETKVMVTSNRVQLTDVQVERVARNPNWNLNEAFSHVYEDRTVPQIKTRPIEAIFNKTLVLLKADPWKTFEFWFKPEEHFLYYYGAHDLQDKLRDITVNWQDYEHIPEAAYNYAMKRYTTEEVFKRCQ